MLRATLSPGRAPGRSGPRESVRHRSVAPTRVIVDDENLVRPRREAGSTTGTFRGGPVGSGCRPRSRPAPLQARAPPHRESATADASTRAAAQARRGGGRLLCLGDGQGGLEAGPHRPERDDWSHDRGQERRAAQMVSGAAKPERAAGRAESRSPQNTTNRPPMPRPQEDPGRSRRDRCTIFQGRNAVMPHSGRRIPALRARTPDEHAPPLRRHAQHPGDAERPPEPEARLNAEVRCGFPPARHRDQPSERDQILCRLRPDADTQRLATRPRPGHQPAPD